jgi:hypothetical protein
MGRSALLGWPLHFIGRSMLLSSSLRKILQTGSKLSLSVLLAGLTSTAMAQQGGAIEVSDKPCSIGEIVRDKSDPKKLLISIPSRFYWKYGGPLVGGNVSIMVAEGLVFRYVQEGEKISSTNLGKYLPLQDGETITLDQGNIFCTITPNLASSLLDVNMKMIFLSKPQENSYKLEIPR